MNLRCAQAQTRSMAQTRRDVWGRTANGSEGGADASGMESRWKNEMTVYITCRMLHDSEITEMQDEEENHE